MAEQNGVLGNKTIGNEGDWHLKSPLRDWFHLVVVVVGVSAPRLGCIVPAAGAQEPQLVAPPLGCRALSPFTFPQRGFRERAVAPRPGGSLSFLFSTAIRREFPPVCVPAHSFLPHKTRAVVKDTVPGVLLSP